MSMKPCSHEQDVFLALHGEVSPVVRLQATLHAWVCPICRERRRDYAKIGAALMTLRPGYAAPSRNAGGSRYSLRLSLVAAILALAVAAFSYYLVQDKIADHASAYSTQSSPYVGAGRVECETDSAAAPRPAAKVAATGGAHRVSK